MNSEAANKALADTFYGQITKCRGKNCGQDIIFVEYYHKKSNQNRKSCVNAKPVSMLIPVFEPDADGKYPPNKPPKKWIRKFVFQPHHATCPNVEEFRIPRD